MKSQITNGAEHGSASPDGAARNAEIGALPPALQLKGRASKIIGAINRTVERMSVPDLSKEHEKVSTRGGRGNGETSVSQAVQIDAIDNEKIHHYVKQIEQQAIPENPHGALTVKRASDALADAASLEDAKTLFGPLWFEKELCILFGATNTGKSILAVQIADYVSSGRQPNFLKIDAEAQSVLYVDCELSQKQFQTRYSNGKENLYEFDHRFLLAQPNPEAIVPEGLTYEDYLCAHIESAIIERDVKVVIIDNITYLKTETERSKVALSLMKDLKALKSKYDLSMLVLAHTPKRNPSEPLSLNDMQGSSMLANFCDSCFAIGASQTDKNLRYLKQLKARNCEVCYGADNVLICRIAKRGNFLGLEFINTGYESEHLKTPKQMKDEKGERVKRAFELHQLGKSQREIAAELGVSAATISNYLNTLPV